MPRRSKNGTILHLIRDVSTSRVMHLTTRVRPDVPDLRQSFVLGLFRGLLGEASRRGVQTVAYAIMDDHLHWAVIPESREALHDATRYVFSQMARAINRRVGRRGKVFAERFWSTCCRTARQAFSAIGYILRNPASAGIYVPGDGPAGWDRFVGANEPFMRVHRFLRSVVGTADGVRRALLLRMASGPVPFSPLLERMQPRLPGL